MKGRYLVKGLIPKKISFQVIENINDFKDAECIVVKSLNPDYTLLLSKVQLIISETGSSVAHLAIIAREYGIPIILVEGITTKVNKKGSLRIEEKGDLNVEMV